MMTCITNILSAIYGADGRLQSKFLLSTKNALSEIAGIANELSGDYALALDGEHGSGVSRNSAHLHLLHHQVSRSLCMRSKDNSD